MWIALGAGGGVLALLLLIFVVRFALRMKDAYTQVRQEVARIQGPQGVQLYSDPMDGYRVELPDRPVRKMRSVSKGRGTENIPEVTFERGEVDRGNGERFWVCRQPYTLPPWQVGRTLDVGALLEAGFKDSTITSKKDFTFAGFPARDTVFEGTRGGRKYVSRARVVVTGNAIYEVQWLAVPAKPETDEVRRFFDTFEFTISPMPLPSSGPGNSPMPSVPAAPK